MKNLIKAATIFSILAIFIFVVVESEQALEIQENKNEAAIAKAEADAEVLIIAAEAKAEANKVLAKSITEEILELEKYEKWDGKLPTYVGGEGNIMIGIE